MEADKLGTFIAQRRKELGLTQATLAEKIHVTDKAVSRWERGIGLPDIGNIEALAEALEVSLIELMQAKKKEETEISTEEAERIVIDTIELSRTKTENQLIKIIGMIDFYGFLFIGVILCTILIFSGMNVIGSVGSILFGLISWMIPIWFLSIRTCEKKGAAVLTGLGFASVSLIIQFLGIANEVYTGDYSALLDTMHAIVMIVVLYIGLTLLLNIVMIKESKKDRKSRNGEIVVCIVLGVFFCIMSVMLFLMGTILWETLRFSV